VFMYLDEYPELLGHQNIAEYLARKAQGEAHLKESDRNFEKLCKVAGLSPKELHDLLGKSESV